VKVNLRDPGSCTAINGKEGEVIPEESDLLFVAVKFYMDGNIYYLEPKDLVYLSEDEVNS
jgi:hypothetical protein